MQPARLGAFWFGIQVVWTSVLGVVLQDRITALASNPVRDYALLAAGGAALAAAVQVGAGLASDRLRSRSGDRRAFYGTGVALAVPALVLLTAAPSMLWLCLALAALQSGMNVAGGPYQAIVGDYVDASHVGRASAWMSINQFAGSVTGLVLTIVLHGAVLGAALAACLVVAWWVTDRQVARCTPVPYVRASLRLSPSAWIVIGSRALINVGFYTLFGFLFFFVHESLGIADARTATGLLFLAFTVTGVAGAALAGGAADRRDKRVVVSVAAAAIALAVGVFAVAPSFPVALACALGAGAAWGAFFTADWAIAYAVLPRAALATAMGIWNLAATAAQVVAPGITAPIVRIADARSAGLGPRLALLCVIVEFALGTLCLWRVRIP